MKNLFKIFSLLIVFCMAFALSACGDSNHGGLFTPPVISSPPGGFGNLPPRPQRPRPAPRPPTALNCMRCHDSHSHPQKPGQCNNVATLNTLTFVYDYLAHNDSVDDDDDENDDDEDSDNDNDDSTGDTGGTGDSGTGDTGGTPQQLDCTSCHSGTEMFVTVDCTSCHNPHQRDQSTCMTCHNICAQPL